MIDLGFVTGTLGLAAAIIAIVYTRMQAGAARIQAQEAARISTLESNSELLERSRDVRRRHLTSPAIREEFVRTSASQPPLSELADLWKSEDGFERYLLYRDAMDTAQDAFFLRRRGVMSDEYWYVWTKVHMTIWGKFPGFEKTFLVSSQAGFLHPDFVKFYEPIFQGGDLKDPATSPRSLKAVLSRTGT